MITRDLIMHTDHAVNVANATVFQSNWATLLPLLVKELLQG